MPVRRGKDKKGPYYMYGHSNCKYHYKAGNKRSRERAKKKAARQGRAIKANQIL